MPHIMPNHMLSSNKRPPNNANVKLDPNNCVGCGASSTFWSKLHTIVWDAGGGRGAPKPVQISASILTVLTILNTHELTP